jgi:catechol 2,3-dioxygenase-like lactoylglutathione lyase family enzyme
VHVQLTTGGVHHLALVAKDLKATHDFYTNVMGMKLTCAIHVPPFPETDAMHVFYDMGGGNQLAFFWFKDAPDPVVGQAQPKSPAHVNANGSMHHLAFGVDTEEDLLTFRGHLKEHGVKVTPMIDHEFCKSIYFQDPDGMQLEISYWVRTLDHRDIQPNVLRQIGLEIEQAVEV